MKRIGAFSLAIFIFVLSVFSVIPVYADGDKTVLPCNLKQTMAFSSSDAQAYVAAHKDIYSQDGYLLFAYTPAASYNWNLCKDGQLTNIHMSDKQVANYIMTNRPFMSMYTVLSSLLSNNNSFRGFCSGLGAIFLKDSDAGTKILDTLTGNYNYLDSLNYDEDSQTITMSNDNGSVDKLRKEIKKYYYISNGMFYFSSNTTNINDVVSTSRYDDMILYQEDYNLAINYDYILYNNSFMVGFNSSDIGFFYYIGKNITSNYYHPLYSLQAVDDDLNPISLSIYSNFNLTDDFFASLNASISSDTYITLGLDSLGNSTGSNIKDFFNTKGYWYSYGIRFDNLLRNGSSSSLVQSWEDGQLKLYSKKNVTTYAFTSYEKLFNYIHGDSSAYLGSAINKVGEDITFSIKDMNENLGSKMDELINSINSNKSNMSADELQNAIDKALDDLNKNTEDIKDNTSSILDKLEEQNQILLQILGVTEFIAYQEVKENSDQYNMSYLKTLLDSMFTGLFNALMYGENTVDDKNTDTASMQSFSVSNAAAPVAVYSDDIAVYDSSGSGGGSSFGGGSDSSGGHFFDLKNGLFGKFPFSIPYQCYNWLQILQRDPEAPTFTLDYGYLFGCSGDPKFVLSFDLSRYNDIAEVGRSFCRLFMTLMLALGIYHKNKGEM